MKKIIAGIALAVITAFVPAPVQADDSYGIRPKFRISQEPCEFPVVKVRPSKHYDFEVTQVQRNRYYTIDFYVDPGYYFLDAKREGRYTVSEAGQSAHVLYIAPVVRCQV